MKKTKTDLARLETGVINLDEILGGGLPKGSVVVVAGAPGSGKTILSQQICFHNATAKAKVLCFNTLSEPTAKTLRNLKQFSYFDGKKLGRAIHFVDLGATLRTKGLEATSALIMQNVRELKPAIVLIDSFKVFGELAKSAEEFRQFGYELIVNLMAWEATTLLLGEYSAGEYESNPLFSIADGLVVLAQRESFGENQRFFRIVKLRSTAHSRDEHPFLINDNGVELYAPRVAIRREKIPAGLQARCRTGIEKFDEVLGPGIPWGSSLLIGGVAGTGKTVLSLEFIYRGALRGEKGILFSFEETEERLRATAQGLGWDIGKEIDRGMIEIVFIPQPDIMVEAHILMMRERITATKAQRVVIDSVSVFLHKVNDPQLSREKVFHLCSIVQNAGAVGFFPTDIPYGSAQVSRFGVEETVVDGVVILTSTEEGLERERYLEVYKLRNTAHLKGRHNIVIGRGGISVFPRYGDAPGEDLPPPALDVSTRIKSGVPGLDALLDGGLLRRSVTIVSGSAGIGKSTIGTQFLLEGARKREKGLYVTLEEGPEQLTVDAETLKLPMRAAIKAGKIEFLYVSREHIRAGQFLSVLADKLKQMNASRLVLDAPTHLVTERMAEDEFRHVLYKLAVRFKMLGVTSVITLESPSLSLNDMVTERNLSPIADNLLMLRYERTGGQMLPTLTVVKTRGSAHDRGTHPISIGQGGIRVGPTEASPDSGPSKFLTATGGSPRKRKAVR